MVSKGRSAAYKQTHARILLLGDEAQEGGAMKDNRGAGLRKRLDGPLGLRGIGRCKQWTGGKGDSRGISSETVRMTWECWCTAMEAWNLVAAGERDAPARAAWGGGR